MPPDARLFASPGRYLQGPGILDRIGSVAGAFAGTPVLVTDQHVLELLGERLEAVEWSERPHVVLLEGDITFRAVDQMVEACRRIEPGIVVGLGGGKALDAGKALSVRLGIPVMTVPTIASNDSPTSSAIAMYDEDHHLVAVDMMRANPVAVLVDTQLIATAPSDFLRSGIGDAVAKVFEAEGCAHGTGLTPLGTRPLGMALAIGQCCFQTLHAHARQALADCEAGLVTDALEQVVEAAVLMSGLAFENGGLSLAHSLTRGLMRVDGARSLLHGYHVAWGALVQIEVEGRGEEEVLNLARFLSSVGLPTCSADLGLVAPLADQHAVIARHTLTAPHLANLPVAVDEQVIISAIARVDELASMAN